MMRDSMHLHRSGVPGAVTGDVVPLLGAAQVSDRPRSQDAEPDVLMSSRLLPGDGDLPLASVLDRFVDRRPDVPLGIEVFNQRLREMSLVDAAHAATVGMEELVHTRLRGRTPA